MRTKAIWSEISSAISGEFDFTDLKGRRIGYEIRLYEAQFVEIGEDHSGIFYKKMLPGYYFMFYPQATRDGKKYGACQQDRFFKTKEEREIAIKKYIESARKRNQRKIQKIFQEF